MNLRAIPFVEKVFESGARDWVFDALLLAGPLVLLLLAVLGRSMLSTAIAVVYVGVFVGHVMTNAIR